jgi:hypothetical protein
VKGGDLSNPSPKISILAIQGASKNYSGKARKIFKNEVSAQ